MSKITNLEKFVQSDIYNPYKNILDDAYNGLVQTPRDLENAVYHLKNVPEFSKLVMGRLSSIKYTFPEYIKHPLVDYIKDNK